ncbi:protein monoglycylase TTLL8 [Peromyscus eremicus]|uniref:protein monoglycylase TTLL8 n=1 Tax=Peromyscus eremicus TaxID=42410 RepID=UPI0027DCE5E1|nr:protein monoglycylase TTLL8 [Peromyscus eremicus]
MARARTVRSLSPRPRPRHGTGHSSDRSMGLDPEPKLSVSASNGARTQSAPRVSTARRSHRPPHVRSRLQPLLPVRPRSPTPRVGRHSGRRKPGRQRHGSAQCAAQPGAVARGDHKTPSREARGSCRAARASGRVPAGAGGQRNQLLEASMENGERKKLSSALPDEDHKEENKLKQGIPQDLSSSPKLDRYKIARQLTEKAIKVNGFGDSRVGVAFKTMGNYFGILFPSACPRAEAPTNHWGWPLSLRASCPFWILLFSGNAFIPDSRSYFSQCQTLLSKISSVNPQTEIDGIRNIWIIKPAAKSRGRDIVCMDRVENILELVATDNQATKDNKWVVQKYIETPMLIYDTKFDIRQWFLVTDWNPLTIWFYKESYLRFSTQRFSLDKLDSAIHLCNNSIQRRLKNDKERSPLLPGHNMWTSTRFQEYLQKRGRGTTWGTIIYPSMKKAVTNAMRVAQDHVEARKNSFELYGADFILGRDFKPWLIEINSSPTMHPSTPVTAQLCAQVQEDTIKVVVDRKLDRNCDIGNFELLWRQPAVELPPFNGSDLCVEGISVKKPKKQMPPITNLSFTDSLLDTTLKVRSPRALLDAAIGPSRMSLRQDWKREEAKVLSATWSVPVMAAEGRGQAKPTYEFSVSNYQDGDSKAPKSVFTRAQSTKHSDPNLTSVRHTAPVLQNTKTMGKPQSPPPRASGLPPRRIAIVVLDSRPRFSMTSLSDDISRDSISRQERFWVDINLGGGGASPHLTALQV